MKLTIEKLVFGGQALARDNGKVFFVWGALPGEEVEVAIINGKKDYAEAMTIKVLKPSPHRLDPRESHYLSCSPWQIMSFEQENYWKTEISREAYIKIGKLSNDLKLSIETNNLQYGYRNKIEYSFVKNKSGVSLSFFNRGSKNKVALNECELAQGCINQAAQKIVDWINRVGIGERSLKSLIVRSNEAGETIAGLFVKDNFQTKFPLPDIQDYPELDDSLVGFHLFYSTHLSPAAVPTETLYSVGRDYLVTQIKNTHLKFGLHNFFQVNIPVFEKTLADIIPFLDPERPIIDFYSGVGSISLPLHQYYSQAELVDVDPEGILFAKQNIKDNHFENCTAFASPSEKMLDLITGDKIIILDPPRAGLHKDIVSKILVEKPQRLIYLSCNPSTQSRDIALLSGQYQVNFLKLYNFFPRTPHIEALCVLDSIS